MDTKKLRQKILDLAIHGKLVPQDPNDEPASVLLERIRAEKERLVKEGKIKKSKALKTSDTPHYENVPFEVPEKWCIVPLEEIVAFSGGKTPSMDNKDYWNNGKHLWVTSKDMKSVNIADSLMKISDVALEQMNIHQKGTLLLVTRSGILRHTLPIAILDKEATVNQDIKTISCYLPCINTFLYYAIKAQEQVILKEYHKDGTTVDSIDFDKFKKLPISLPPIEEQCRIITEINRWFALIDKIEQGKVNLQSAIKQAKNKILDLAIQGKLIPQDPSDEPASELLKRINPNAENTCDNGQYGKMPEEWTMCRLRDIFKITMGQSPNGETINNDSGIEFHQGKLCFSEIYLQHSNQFTTEPTKIAEDNSLLLCVRAPVGTINITQRRICIGRGLCSLKPLVGNLKFYFYLMQTLKTNLEEKATGTTFKAISTEIIKNEIMPLPPLVEQHRIVSKIEELFNQLDQIQKSLEA